MSAGCNAQRRPGAPVQQQAICPVVSRQHRTIVVCDRDVFWSAIAEPARHNLGTQLSCPAGARRASTFTARKGPQQHMQLGPGTLSEQKVFCRERGNLDILQTERVSVAEVDQDIVTAIDGRRAGEDVIDG